MPDPTRVALIQMACAPSIAANLDHAADLVRLAARDGAQLICLPELFRAQYFCQREDHALFALAEPIPGPSTARLAAIVREFKITLIASLFERRAPGLYHNTAAILDHTSDKPDKIAGIYRKMHIPDDPLYYEKFYFTPGDTGFRAWQTAYAKIGVLICWDQWFPEAARLTALQGAQILFYPTAIGWHPKEKSQYGAAQHDAWELIQRSHAVANGCYVASPNRIGLEKIRGPHNKPVHPDGIQFWGQSFVAAPNGQVINRAPANKEDILLTDCDLAQVRFARTHWPFLRDRRIDAYGDLTKRLVD